MTCPYYKGKHPDMPFFRCRPGAINFPTANQRDIYINRYCLGVYPDCREYKAKEKKDE